MPQTTPQAGTSATTQPDIPQRQLDLLLTSAGIVPLDGIGWIEVTGSDRVRWLNGMVTNSVQALAPGAGCYNFFLNAQGRIQGDAYIFAEPDHLLLETGLPEVASLLAMLDRFIIMDDVELRDISSHNKGLLLAGPRASELLTSLNLLPPANTLSLAHIPWRSHLLTVIRAYSPLVPRFEIWADNLALTELSAHLSAHGIAECGGAALDLLRICEGTLLFGVDIRDRDLPQETGANRALHFSKGCYLGQEIVERIHSRGNVHRTFHAFHLQGAGASPGLALSVDDKPIGELTSVAVVPIAGGEIQIGLGYIRREALAHAKSIHYDGGIAQPASLPFDRAKIL